MRITKLATASKWSSWDTGQLTSLLHGEMESITCKECWVEKWKESFLCSFVFIVDLNTLSMLVGREQDASREEEPEAYRKDLLPFHGVPR